jgi:hypothetical protein
MRGDIVDMIKALTTNSLQSRKRLVGPGVFSHADLQKMKEHTEQAKAKNLN